MHDSAQRGAGRIRVAFCSASVGCGHTRAGVAVHDALAARGRLADACFLEVLSDAPRWFATAYRDGYLCAIRHLPTAVGAMYAATDVPRRERRFMGALLDRMEDGMLARLRARRELHEADVVVSTHFLATAVLGRMRLRGELRVPLATVVTDEHPHSVWIHPGSDLTCVASQQAREAAITAGLDPAAVDATGIPIDPRFCTSRPAMLIEGLAGIAPGGAGAANAAEPVILVSGGGHGLGQITACVRGLLSMRTAATIVVVCGKNAALERTLRGLALQHAEAAGRPSLRVLGYTNRMHDLMAAAQLLVGKPGGLTTTEARAVGLPMLLLGAIPGQEERNAQALVSAGAALRLSRPADAGVQAQRLLEDPVALWRMRSAAAAAGRPRAAFDVATRVEALVRRSSAFAWRGRLTERGAPSAPSAVPATMRPATR